MNGVIDYIEGNLPKKKIVIILINYECGDSKVVPRCIANMAWVHMVLSYFGSSVNTRTRPAIKDPILGCDMEQIIKIKLCMIF